MNEATKNAYVKAARKNNHRVDTYEQIPPDVKAHIRRTHNFTHLSGKESIIANTAGDSVADKIHNWKKAEQAAQRAVDDRLSRENPKEPPTALRMRLDYLENKTNVDPLQRRHLDRQIREAKKELATEQAELAEVAKIEATQAAIATDARLANALENAQSYLDLATTDDERTDALFEVKMLQSISRVDQVEFRVSDYWTRESARAEKAVEKEMLAQNETLAKASEAVGANADQTVRVLAAEQAADIARKNAE